MTTLPPPTGPADRRPRDGMLAAAALFLAAAALLFVVYRPALTGGFYLDSKGYVRDTHHFQGGVTLRQAVARVLEPGYNPAGRRIIPNLSIAIQTHKAGPQARPLRIGNVLLHALNVTLAFFVLDALLALLLPAWSPRRRRWCALVAALLWGFNPFLVDTVAYVVQRSVLVETFFFLAAFLVFLRLDPSAPLTRKLGQAGLLLFLLALALLSKEVALLFPVVAALLAWYVPALRERWRGRPDLPALLVATVAVSALTLLLAKGSQPLVVGMPEQLPFDRAERLLTEGRIVLHQLGLFLAPLPGRLTLTPFYEISRGVANPPATLAALLVIAGITTAAILARRRMPWWGVALVWYFALHLAESTVWLLHLAFPHRSYLPTVLAPLPLVVLLSEAASRLGPRAGRAASGLAVAALAALLAGTAVRASVWGDEERFWARAIETAPEAALPYVSLSGFYLEHGRLAEAAATVERAFRDARLESAPARETASLHVNRGITLAQSGKLLPGIEALEQALRLEPRNSDHLYNLAFFLERAGRREEAKEGYRRLVTEDPSYPDAHLGLALLLLAEGKRAEALALARTELQYFPQNARAAHLIRSLANPSGRLP